MVCPNCGNKLNQGEDLCPICNQNVSFTSKSNDDALDIISKIVKYKKIYSIIVVILLLSIFIFANSIINGHFGIFKIIIDNRFILIILGILFLFITIYLYFRNNKLKKYTPIMVIASILIILIPITYSKIISNITTGNVEYKDYSKSKYIKVGSAKIPSLYSIIGERKIEMSGYIKNNYDEGLKQTYDVAYIYM